MLRSLIAYDIDGNVVATLDHMVAKDDEGNVVGLIDFAAHEDASGRMRDVWDVQRLDQPVPPGIAKQVLGRDPLPNEVVTLPPDHPYRLAHETVLGSTTWPEWLGSAAYDFKVEVDANKKATALVHKKSGHRRNRADIEAAISERIAEAHAKHRRENGSDADVSQVPVDIKDIVGGPNRPLLLDEDGRTKPRQKVKRPDLPVVGRAKPF